MRYRSPPIIDAMRQSALGRWMEYLGTPDEIAEAFAFCPADASEPYYVALHELTVATLTVLRNERSAALGSALDVGAGVGRVSFDLARTDLVTEVFALEESPELVSEVELLAAGEHREVVVPISGKKTLRAILRPPASAPKLRPMQGDAHMLPFAASEFACVLAFGLIDRVHRPKAVVGEIARVLKPGGVAVVSCLHDFVGGPADAKEWPDSAAELFANRTWETAESRNLRLDLRQNARYLERFMPEIVIARRALQ